MNSKTNNPASAGRMPALVVPLPCPFCGGKGRTTGMPKREHDHMAFMVVECVSCGACGPVTAGCNLDRVIGKWNDRDQSMMKKCGWRGMAGGEGCIRPHGHEGGHGFSDGSGFRHNADVMARPDKTPN